MVRCVIYVEVVYGMENSINISTRSLSIRDDISVFIMKSKLNQFKSQMKAEHRSLTDFLCDRWLFVSGKTKQIYVANREAERGDGDMLLFSHSLHKHHARCIWIILAACILSREFVAQRPLVQFHPCAIIFWRHIREFVILKSSDIVSYKAFHLGGRHGGYTQWVNNPIQPDVH